MQFRNGLWGASALPGLLLAGDRLLRSLTGSRVGLRALAADREVTAMPQTLVGADLHLPADVGLHLAAKVTFHLQVGLIDGVAQGEHVLVGQVLGAQVGADAGGLQQFEGSGASDPVDVGERDLHPLVAGKIDANESRHLARYSFVVPTGVGRVPSPTLDRGPGL